MIGFVEVAVGGFGAVAADGLHNLADAWVFKKQGNGLDEDDPDANRQQRKVVYWTLASLSGAVAVKAGVDLSIGVSPHDGSDIGLYAATTSFVYNSALFVRLRQGTRRHNEKLGPEMLNAAPNRNVSILRDHCIVDVASAGFAVAGAAAQHYGFMGAEEAAAIAGGLLGVKVFMPTEARLADAHEH